MKQVINNHIEKAEILLKCCSNDLSPFIKPFLRQLNKLNAVSDEVFYNNDGQRLMEQIAAYSKLLNKDLLDKDELFAHLIAFTIKSVLIIKVNKEYNGAHFKVGFKPFKLN